MSQEEERHKNKRRLQRAKETNRLTE